MRSLNGVKNGHRGDSMKFIIFSEEKKINLWNHLKRNKKLKLNEFLIILVSLIARATFQTKLMMFVCFILTA